VAIGRLAIKRAVIRQLRIEELEVGRLRVRELAIESQRGGDPPRSPVGDREFGSEEPLPPGEPPLGPPD
jgi:hypothetical protein